MHGKSGCFASQNLRFRNVKTQLPLFNEIIFTKQGRISVFVFSKKTKSKRSNIVLQKKDTRHTST
ncbi:hypothetical protein CTM63_06750 [Prevotella intermedia]|uniref:Uncharacterized protein n=1 Tax=Prevotella intermedia TaxID=28131 RepID=A0A246EV86_PREIN|nr:hypothetical protein CTM63_06750 [Prevotella intermedia]OWP33461.1 hypothetical protein CBG55_04555 [Prevotella intermedia]PDP82485.1 hypothetical protein CLI69_05190 [Prevotella intermedia]PJI25373.1 hypothetical protein CTM59_04545 [Prevotella intermedia]